MKITVDFLKTQAALKDLPEETLKAMVAIHDMRAKEIDGEVRKEIHTKYDETVLRITGVEKPREAKSYEHLETQVTKVLSDAKKNAGSTEELKTANARIKTLETQLASNSGDEALKAENVRLTGELSKRDKALRDTEDKYTTELTKAKKDLEDKTIKYNELEFDTAIASDTNFKFKDGVDEELVKSMMQLAKNDVKSTKRERLDDGTFEFRNADGGRLTHENDATKAMTARDIMAQRLKPILAVDQPGGAGSKASNKNRTNSGTLDLGGAKTKEEGDVIIRNHLKAKGVPTGTPEYEAQFLEIRKSSGVSDMANA